MLSPTWYDGPQRKLQGVTTQPAASSLKSSNCRRKTARIRGEPLGLVRIGPLIRSKRALMAAASIIQPG